MKIDSSTKTNMTEGVYKVVRCVTSPFLDGIFSPIVLNRDIVPKDGRSVVYAPNHRSTLDPLVMLSSINSPVHWAALKRFFDAEDSIFNNSKNPALCYLTKYLFLTMGLIPIDRESNNFNSIRLMRRYLKEGRDLGIFPEGTTNKHPEEVDLGPVKPGLSIITRSTDSWIQPISIVWTKDDKMDQKAIINFREPFLASSVERDECTDLWISEVEEGIKENKEIITSLKRITQDDSVKKLSLKIK